jgi:hypothetical protein
VDTIAALITNVETTKPMKPRERAFDDPAGAAESAAVGRPSLGELRLNPAAMQQIAMGLRVVATVAQSKACEGLASRCLFYPSAGTDTAAPLEMFLPWVDDFWFADLAYDLTVPFSRQHQMEDSREEKLCGTTVRTDTPYSVDVRHERHRWPQRSGPINIHRCRGHGYDVWRAAFVVPRRAVSVFFHRGDSPGEGGSNFHWLGRKRLPDVLGCLEPGGLVVSDGSLAMSHFAKFRGTEMTGSEALNAVTPFTAASRRFVCVGYLGPRNGPTLVWKTSEA